MARKAEVKIAYVPFKTFLTALDTLRNGIPDPLDRSVFRNQSGSTQSMLISSFKALGCIDEGDHPQPILSRLVDPGQRKAALEEVLRNKYREVFALGMAATQQQFDNVFREYGVSGDTHKKARSFFLRAGQLVGVKLSPHIAGARAAGSENGGVTSAKPPRRRRKRDSGVGTYQEPIDRGGGTSSGSTKTVNLRSGGGTVTLTVSMDPFGLEDDDQKFVFGLIRQLKNYEQKPPLETEASSN